MPELYHINPETLRPNLCRADEVWECEYYDSTKNKSVPHFTNKLDARKYVNEVLLAEGVVEHVEEYPDPLKFLVSDVEPSSPEVELTPYLEEKEVYVHSDGRVLVINDLDEVSVYKDGEERRTILTVGKIRSGFGAWEKVEEKGERRGKMKEYRDVQDAILDQLCLFIINHYYLDFSPKGAVENRYWDEIIRNDCSGRSETVKQTMIVSAFNILQRAGFKVSSVVLNANSPYSLYSRKHELSKYDIQQRQLQAIRSLQIEADEFTKKNDLGLL